MKPCQNQVGKSLLDRDKKHWKCYYNIHFVLQQTGKFHVRIETTTHFEIQIYKGDRVSQMELFLHIRCYP